MTDTPQTDQPSTAAGRALLAKYVFEEYVSGHSLNDDERIPLILAIEAEARAEGVQDERAKWQFNEGDGSYKP